MKPKTEIYWVKYNKYKLENGDVAFSQYMIDVPYNVTDMAITPVKIVKLKDHIIVYFSDGGRHEFGHLPDCELFYRPVKKDKP
jgi:hypothetical protein